MNLDAYLGCMFKWRTWSSPFSEYCHFPEFLTLFVTCLRISVQMRMKVRWIILLFSVFHERTVKYCKMAETLKPIQNTLVRPLYLKTIWILLRIPSLNSERYADFKFDWLSRDFCGLNYSNTYIVNVKNVSLLTPTNLDKENKVQMGNL